MFNTNQFRSFSLKTILTITATILCLFFINSNAYAQAPGVTFYDQNEGTFKQDGGTITLTIDRHQTDDAYGVSKQGIMVKASNAENAVFYVRSEYNQANKYIMDLNKAFSIVFKSNNTVDFIFPGGSAGFTRVDVTTQPVALKLRVPVFISKKEFKVDGDNKIEQEIWSQGQDYDPNQIHISFSKKSGITWWKGIKITNEAGEELGIIEMQDSNNGPISKSFNYSSFSGDYLVIEFWKAKAFGAHTFIQKEYIKLSECKGNEVRLFWVND